MVPLRPLRVMPPTYVMSSEVDASPTSPPAPRRVLVRIISMSPQKNARVNASATCTARPAGDVRLMHMSGMNVTIAVNIPQDMLDKAKDALRMSIALVNRAFSKSLPSPPTPQQFISAGSKVLI